MVQSKRFACILIFIFLSVCESIDIRGDLLGFQRLASCTVIEGHLKIVLIDHEIIEDSWKNMTFPKLREITDYLLLLRVDGLKSLFQLFPNLALIRGQTLVHNYALVVFELDSLENVGLENLMRISRGGVWISKNLKLCYVHTVSWANIVASGELNDIIIKENQQSNECIDTCPLSIDSAGDSKELCGNIFSDKPYCWTGKQCQKLCPKNCPGSCYGIGFPGEPRYEVRCCHEECLGGCSGPSDGDCFACAHVYFDGKCQRSCGNGTYKHRDRRCVTEDECRIPRRIYDSNGHQIELQHWKINNLDKSCVLHCPTGFDAPPTDLHRCEKCIGPCPKECEGTVINNKSRMQHFAGCTRVHGNLEIQLDVSNINEEELTMNLGSIDEITGALHIKDSSSLTTLRFFSKLQVIGSEIGRSQLAGIEGSNESLLIQANEFLQEIWDTNLHPNLTVMNGNIQFIANRRLCVKQIQEFVSAVRLVNADLDSRIYSNINGDKAVCGDAKQLHLKLENVGAKSARISWTKLDITDIRKLLNWRINYRHAWNVKYETPEKNFTELSLTPFQRYVVYVQANTMQSSGVGAISNIIFFTTNMTVPSPVQDLVVHPINSTTLELSWRPPKQPNGILDHYMIEWYTIAQEKLELRDYCKHRLNFDEKVEPVEKKPALPQQTVSSCPSLHVDEIDENIRKNDIIFEDFLNGLVYVSSSEDNYPHDLVRPMTPVDRHNFTDLYSTATMRDSGIITTLQPPTVPRFANVNSTTFLLLDLVHFQKYGIQVKACNGPGENLCGFSVRVSGHTPPDDDADSIDEQSIQETEFSESQVQITWNEPSSPNGLIATYHIHLIPVGGYIASGLSAGNWSYRIRATSLAIQGNWTTWRYFVINGPIAAAERPDISYSSLSEGLTAIIVVVIITASATVVALTFFMKKRKDAIYNGFIFSSNSNYRTADEACFPEEWEVPRDKVRLSDEIGKGSFGMVYRGILYDTVPGERELCVAVKTVMHNSAGRQDCLPFLSEASTMIQFDYHHIVKLFGVVSKGYPVLVIMELMENGDLKSFLRANRPEKEADYDNKSRLTLTSDIFIRWAAEIADGMAYIASKKIAHRDLAARNCMVSANKTVKIGDFGMSREVYSNDYYRKGTAGLLPVRWMAPESLYDGYFTTQSDVWSFGVVLWEMATYGAQPYPGLSNEDVVTYVLDRKTMSAVDGFCDKLSKLMLSCWNWKSNNRPSFGDIVELLAQDLPETFRQMSYHLSSAENKADSSSPSQVLDRRTVDDVVSVKSTAVDIDRIRSSGGCDSRFSPLGAVPCDHAIERGDPDGRGSDARICRVEVPPSTMASFSPQHYSGGGESTNDSQKGGSDVALLRWPLASPANAVKKARNENQTFKWLLGFAHWKSRSAIRSGH